MDGWMWAHSLLVSLTSPREKIAHEKEKVSYLYVSHLLPCGLQMLIWVLFPLSTWRVNCRPMWHSSGVGLILIWRWVSPNGCTVCDVMWGCIFCRVTCKFKSQLDFYWMFGLQKIISLANSWSLIKVTMHLYLVLLLRWGIQRTRRKPHLVSPQTPANRVQLQFLHKHLLFWFEPRVAEASYCTFKPSSPRAFNHLIFVWNNITKSTTD